MKVFVTIFTFTLLSASLAQPTNDAKARGSKYLLIAGGLNEYQSAVADVEVVELLKSGKIVKANCPKPADLPMNLYDSVGTNMFGRPLICGGKLDWLGARATDKCFEYDPFAKVWFTSEDKLNEDRAQASSTQLNSTHWLVAGGSMTLFKHPALIYSKADGFVKSFSLDHEFKGHCAVKITDDEVLFVGDKSEKRSDWIYNLKEEAWTELPELLRRREHHFCARAVDAIGDDIVVVGGGDAKNGQSKLTTEIFHIPTRTWTLGPDMPYAKEHAGSSAVTIDNKVIVAGGSRSLGGDRVLSFDPVALTWTETTSRLILGRSAHVVMEVDGKDYNCP